MGKPTPLHWAPEAAAATKTSKLAFVANRKATYSPDLNPIENLFANAEDYMLKKHFGNGEGEGPAETVAATWQRFLDACAHVAAKGEIANMAKSMPKRCKDVIEAKGGATKW